MTLAFDRCVVGFDALPAPLALPAHALAAAGRIAPAGLHLLTRDSPIDAADAPWLDRARAAAFIARLNPSLPPPPVTAHYVVAGQQVGLLTGPLYTFLKAVAAIGLARDLSAQHGAPVLPLFWMASEDHDVLEVNRVTLGGRRFTHPYPGPLARGAVPQVGEIGLLDARGPLLAFLRETLPPTAFTAWVLGLVAAADFTNYATAFRDLMRALFERRELRLVDPITLRPLTAPVLAALVERWGDIDEGLRRGARRVEALGLAAPIERAGLYEIVSGRRVPVEIDAAGARISTGRASLAETADAIRSHPERFSPGAALRPICQDAALPVLATLGGPTEIAYLWQIEPLYALAGIQPSLRHPRPSVTFLEPAVTGALAKLGLEPARAFAVSAMLGAQAGDTGDTDEADDAPGAAEIRAQAQALLATIDAHAPQSAPRWLRNSRDAIASGSERIARELIEARRARLGRDRARLEKIRDAILPEGKLQERVVNVFELLNRHGPQFVERAIAELDPWECRHQIVTLGG
jgi:bacillithiol biosynthesis cysteine-adding enzyme BshC